MIDGYNFSNVTGRQVADGHGATLLILSGAEMLGEVRLTDDQGVTVKFLLSSETSEVLAGAFAAASPEIPLVDAVAP